MVHILMLIAFGSSFISFRNKRKEIPLLLGFIILFIFAALRYDYGNDYWPYHDIFVNAQNNFNSYKVEYLFFQMNKLFPTYSLFLTFLSFVYLYATYKLIEINVIRKYRWASFLLFILNPYLFFLSLSSLRQTLALCLFIFALLLSVNNKLWKWIFRIILIVLAVFIHQTALLLLPIILIYDIKKSKVVDSFEKFVFILLPIILLFFPNILDYLIKIVLDIFDNLNYLSYIKNNDPNSLRSTLLTLIIYLYVALNLSKMSGSTYKYCKLYLIGLLFGILSYKYNMFGRFQMYFDIFGIVALPMMVHTLNSTYKNNFSRITYVYVFPIIIALIFILRYYSFFTTDLWKYFFEYKTWLFI